jgi:hypothetical protein
MEFSRHEFAARVGVGPATKPLLGFRPSWVLEITRTHLEVCILENVAKYSNTLLTTFSKPAILPENVIKPFGCH